MRRAACWPIIAAAMVAASCQSSSLDDTSGNEPGEPESTPEEPLASFPTDLGVPEAFVPSAEFDPDAMSAGPGDPSGGDPDAEDPSGGDPDPAGGDSDPDPVVGPVNPPHSTVIVGGPPETCQVWEFEVPVERPAWKHLPEGTVIPYVYNPPVGGPSYEMWAAHRQYDEPVARERDTHNLRHGAIVMVYRPDAPQEVIDALEEIYPFLPGPNGRRSASPDCPRMGIMTPDPMLDDTFAVLAFGWMMTSNCVPEMDDVLDFAQRHVYLGEEAECYNGAWPVREPCYRYEDVRFTQWTYEVPTGTNVAYDIYPPSSGPFYPDTVRWGRFDAVVPAPYWTGVLAKGGVVVIYRPDADPETIAGLKRAYDELPSSGICPSNLTVMVQDDRLEGAQWAMMAFNHYMQGECFRGWEMHMFVSSRRGHGPYPSCEDGTFAPYVPPSETPEPEAPAEPEAPEDGASSEPPPDETASEPPPEETASEPTASEPPAEG